VTTEFQVAETVEQLETQHVALKRRIAALVDDSQKGKNDGAEIPKLTREAAALSSRIDAARAERDRAASAARRREQDEARAELTQVRDECLRQRAAFLEHYRAACIALGSYLDLKARASELTGKTATAAFGPMPEDRNALRALEFVEPPMDAVRAGLKPKIDADWRLSFPITPMDEQFKTR
jgi:hypothetical protein